MGVTAHDTFIIFTQQERIFRGELFPPQFRFSLAWKWIEQCYSEPISNWLACHPQWEIATKLGSKEQYVARTIKRFKQMTMLNKRIECTSIADAFRYLRVCLNGIILDRLRFYSCSKEKPS